MNLDTLKAHARSMGFTPDESKISIRSEVHEHRAPTDESIKLLNEMQRKLEDRLLAATKIEENSFKGSLHVIADRGTLSYRAIARFMLNGKEYKVEVELDDFGTIQDHAKAIVEAVQQKLSEVITEMLVLPAIAQLPNYNRGRFQ